MISNVECFKEEIHIYLIWSFNKRFKKSINFKKKISQRAWKSSDCKNKLIAFKINFLIKSFKIKGKPVVFFSSQNFRAL